MIYVFKTSVEKIDLVKYLSAELNVLLPDSKWNFDLEDCDNIFRVDSNLPNVELRVIIFFQKKGIECTELI